MAGCDAFESHVRYLRRDGGVSAATASVALYQAEEATRLYHQVNAHPDYHIFRSCRTSLASLLQSSFWAGLRAHPPCLIVDLGTGQGEKFCDVIASFPAAAASPAFLALDGSEPMLRSAWAHFQRQLGASIESRAIELVVGDFTADLGLVRHVVDGDCRPGRLVVLMLGLTFANFRENQLLEEMQKLLRPGDHVVLGLEFARLGDGRSQSEAALAGIYNNDACRAFFRFSYGLAVAEAEEIRIDAETVDGACCSDVPAAKAVLIRRTTDKTSEPVIYSRRYDERPLLAYLARNGLECVFQAECATHSFYRQVVLRRL